jgi:hypothetical protein
VLNLCDNIAGSPKASDYFVAAMPFWVKSIVFRGVPRQLPSKLRSSMVNIASRRQSSPQLVFRFGTPFNHRCGRLLNRDCCGKHTFQPGVVDTSEILPQGHLVGLVSSQDGRAEVHARLPKETELLLLVATPAKPVDCCRNSPYGYPVGMIQRYRKAQDREVPRPYHPGVPFVCSIAQFHGIND